MSVPRDVTLSVVFPVYNEERRIGEALRRVRAYLSLKGLSWDVWVSNDGSTDGTARIVEEFSRAHPESSVHLLSSAPNRGKGYAARQGILAARGRRLLLTDADLSAPIKEVDKLIAALERGADVAIGSRALRSPGCDVRQSPKRWLSGRVFNAVVRASVLPGIRDSQCGFKCFTNAAAQKLFSEQKLDGFSFDVEVLYLARKAGLKIAEVPVMWSEDRDSQVRVMRDSVRMVRDLLKIKRLHA